MIYGIQKASVTKRIGAFLLDLILLVIVATGMMLVVSAVSGFDKKSDRLDAYCSEYAAVQGIETSGIEEFFDQYEQYVEEYENQHGEAPQKTDNPYEKAYSAMCEDEEFVRTYAVTNNLMLVIPSLGIFFAYAITEFAVPLFLKNGQSIGKKVFSLGVVRIDSVRVSPFQLFVRTLLGKFTIETMIPLMLFVMNGLFGTVGFVVIGLILIFNIVLLAATKNRTVIHDAFAQTVVIDMPTQMIFDTAEDLLAYKTRKAAEEAEKAAYN